MIWVERPVESHIVQRSDDLEHVHVSIIKEDLFKSACRGQVSADISEVNLEYLPLSSVIVDLVKDELCSSGFVSRADTVQQSVVLARGEV